MIHYHGGPITPESCAARAWMRRHAFVSYAAPQQIALAASLSQSFALDNGAFSTWKRGKPADWPGYYERCDRWLSNPSCDWAVIPGAIGATEGHNYAPIYGSSDTTRG